MRKVNCVFLIGAILFFNLLSLNSSFSFQSTNPLEPASNSPEDPLKIGTTSLGYNLDPVLAEYQASLDIVDQVWEGLYAYNLDDPNLRIIPRLAADCGSWNKNATVFNVTLRSGITFHNGEAFTATDVNYTFSRLWQLCVFQGLELRSLSPWELRDLYFPYGFNTTKMNASVGYGFIINKTVIVDDLHVSFELNFPYSPFQSLLCFRGSYIMDESTTGTDTFLEYTNINDGTAIGTGPYKITEHNTEKCTFEYWEDYYRGTPAIKKIIFVKSLSSDTISQSLLDGELDIARTSHSDFANDFEEAEHIYIGPYREESIISFIYMNTQNIDRSLRHAINYAIDYDKIINEIYVNSYIWKYSRMTSIIPPGIPYHKECNVPILNITKARQILIEAGYTEGHGLNENSTDEDWKDIAESSNPIFRIGYIHSYSFIQQDIGVLIKDNLKMIGIRVDMAVNHWQVWINSVDNLINIYGENYMFLSGFKPDYNDPCQLINILMSNTSSVNFAQVNDPWLQLAMDEALTITNEDDRKALYYDIQDYIATDLMPFLFLVNGWSRSVHTNYVTTQPNPMDKLYIFPFSWHGVNTTFTDPYLELWCNSGSPPVLEFWPEPIWPIPGYPMMFISICFFAIIPLWIKKYKKNFVR
jgi:ABC-type transport system substrate-binding protein